MTGQGVREQKKILRNKFRILRDGIPKEKIAENSRKIWERFFQTECYCRAERIIFYLNIKSEVETIPYLDQVLRDGKKVAVPRCDIAEKKMDMYEIAGCNMLVKGAYGILEPDLMNMSGGAISISEWGKNDVVIVPALAFDRQGFRLGYGAGYYDRFLNGKNVTSAGFAFADCVCESLPHERTDKKVSCLITETGCEFFD